jgi:hypothetical protein
MRRRDKNNTVLLQSAAQEFTGFQQGKNHPLQKKKEGMNRLCNGTEIIVRYLNAVHHFELYNRNRIE